MKTVLSVESAHILPLFQVLRGIKGKSSVFKEYHHPFFLWFKPEYTGISLVVVIRCFDNGIPLIRVPCSTPVITVMNILRFIKRSGYRFIDSMDNNHGRVITCLKAGCVVIINDGGSGAR